mmetsp:Transcript_106970/g.302490  ORF Transcript_106970/g.302490 Transcript_106970/m.302490 type:complete len:219 (+) Transcript_106970:411-1067(+)
MRAVILQDAAPLVVRQQLPQGGVDALAVLLGVVHGRHEGHRHGPPRDGDEEYGLGKGDVQVLGDLERGAEDAAEDEDVDDPGERRVLRRDDRRDEVAPAGARHGREEAGHEVIPVVDRRLRQEEVDENVHAALQDPVEEVAPDLRVRVREDVHAARALPPEDGLLVAKDPHGGDCREQRQAQVKDVQVRREVRAVRAHLPPVHQASKQGTATDQSDVD